MGISDSLARTRLFRLLWIFIEKFGLVGLSVVSFVLFAAWLTPAELGVGVLVIGIVELLCLLLTSAVDSAFVRLEKIDERKDASLFWGGTLVSSIVYGMLILVAACIPDAVSVLPLLIASGLILPLQLCTRVSIAHMRRDGNFKALAKRTLIGKVVGMLLGLSAAFSGWGSWSLVIQAVAMQASSTAILLLNDRRALPVIIDRSFLFELLSVGMPISLKTASWSVLTKGLNVILAMTAGVAAVGYFNFANRLVELPRTAIYGGLMQYALPALSRRKADPDQLHTFYSQSSRLSLMALLPAFVGLALLADPLINVVFGNKWAPAIPVLQGLACMASLSLVFVFTPSLLAALNKTRITLPAELLATGIALTFVYVQGAELGAFVGVCALVIRFLIVAPVNVYAMGQCVGYRGVDLFKDIYPSLVSAAVMSLSIAAVQQHLEINQVMQLVAVPVLGAGIYMLVYSMLHSGWQDELRMFLRQPLKS